MSSKKAIKHIESDSEEISEYYDLSENDYISKSSDDHLSEEISEYYESDNDDLDNSSETYDFDEDNSFESCKSDSDDYIEIYNSDIDYDDNNTECDSDSDGDDNTNINNNILDAPKSKCGRPLEEILVINSKYDDRQQLVRRLLKEGLIQNKCSSCKIDPVWQCKHLVLQLDHINGINTDNRIENLRLLCANCHTQTDTFGSKNNYTNECISCEKKISKKYDKCDECYKKEGTRICNDTISNKTKKCECGKMIEKRSNTCFACKDYSKINSHCNDTRILIPKEELENMVLNQNLSYTEIGKKYEVCKKTIANRCKEYGISSKKKIVCENNN
jgi:hypothetical protein